VAKCLWEFFVVSREKNGKFNKITFSVVTFYRLQCADISFGRYLEEKSACYARINAAILKKLQMLNCASVIYREYNLLSTHLQYIKLVIWYNFYKNC